MTNSALVIGSQTGDLRGADSDARSVAALLQQRKFRVRLRTGKEATRQGILDGYDELIGAVGGDDAAVVYYSGHGNLTTNVQSPSDDPLHDIVPFDYFESTDRDYRGITSLELSIKLQQLVEKTPNATVILDCCHAAQMSRDGAARDAIPRALPHPMRVDLTAHRAALEQLYPGRIAKLGVTGTVDAIRIVACAQSEVAMEYTNASGERTGAFTEALLELLEDIGDTSVSWAILTRAIRERVLRRFPSQRPDIAGRVNRVVFSLEEQLPNNVVSIKQSGSAYEIDAGRIHAVGVGDKYAVAAFQVQDRPVAEARVIATNATTASVEVTWLGTETQLPDQPIAIPLERAAPRRVITVVAPADQRVAIATQIHKTGTLRVRAGDDVEPSIAMLKVADGRLTIEDADGPLFPDATYPDSLEAAVQNLKNLGVARALREIEGEHDVYARELAIKWGVVEIDSTQKDESGAPKTTMRELPDHGAALGLGDRIYCQIENKSQRRLYVHIFNIGLQGNVKLLSHWAPSGIALNGGDKTVLGEGFDGKLKGLGFSWPAELPRSTFPRVDTLLVIATIRQTSLNVLETQMEAMRGAVKGSALEQLLGQVQTGGTRDVSGQTQVDGYYAKQLTCLLHPREGRMTSPEFLVDDAPGTRGTPRSAAAWRAPAATKPRTIAIQLEQLRIENTHAWFATDVRIDALICTRPGEAEPGYRPQTMKFSRVRDGDRAPLDNALLYHGPVRDFVDVCLWVSRDDSDSRALTELIAARAKDPEVKDALAVLLTAAGIAAAPWVAAVGASAVLARVAYEAIRAASGSSIGLYRTSFLAAEHYGIGRYPREGLYRAQDFSFSLKIADQ